MTTQRVGVMVGLMALGAVFYGLGYFGNVLSPNGSGPTWPPFVLAGSVFVALGLVYTLLERWGRKERERS